MTYQQALYYLHSAPRFKGKAALERMRRLCEKLGNPQKELRAVHVAGTNGKGSTANMVAAALCASGYRTGMFISPYVIDFRERIQVNGQYISPEELAAITERVRQADEELSREGLHATEFELVTACGLCYFRQQRCDIAVLEVGLGGRFDATNVIEPPEAAVITKIALDHTAILGGTIEQIAFEKCGILKEGCAAVYPQQDPAAMKVIRQQCIRRGIELHIPDPSSMQLLSCDLEHTHLRYGKEEWDIPLGGQHQIGNALTAMETLHILRTRGWRLPQKAVRQGIASLHFPARLERVCGQPPIYIDGAHNPDGMQSLVHALGSQPFTAVFTAMRDKDYQQTLTLLAGRARRLIVCTLDIPRAASIEELTEAAAPLGCQVLQAANTSQALRLAKEGLSLGESIVVCGSLYLAGEVHALLDRFSQDSAEEKKECS